MDVHLLEIELLEFPWSIIRVSNNFCTINTTSPTACTKEEILNFIRNFLKLLLDVYIWVSTSAYPVTQTQSSNWSLRRFRMKLRIPSSLQPVGEVRQKLYKSCLILEKLISRIQARSKEYNEYQKTISEQQKQQKSQITENIKYGTNKNNVMQKES